MLPSQLHYTKQNIDFINERISDITDHFNVFISKHYKSKTSSLKPPRLFPEHTSFEIREDTIDVFYHLPEPDLNVHINMKFELFEEELPNLKLFNTESLIHALGDTNV